MGHARVTMFYQLSWKTLPGLRGLSCSAFRGLPTEAPDNERGVAVAFPDQVACDEFVKDLEDYFSAQRFSNNAAAFETVKTYILGRMAQQA